MPGLFQDEFLLYFENKNDLYLLKHLLIDAQMHINIAIMFDVVAADHGSGHISNSAKFIKSPKDNNVAVYSILNFLRQF